MRCIKIKSQSKEYKVDFYSTIEETICELEDYLIIIDSNVHFLYEKYFNHEVIIFNCNENNKTLDGSILILKELIKRKVKSNGKIAIIGGGIMQDVASFACSIYCRGIDYILIPTTLLSQCDSCIGGKTSINFESAKNILGTFCPPKKVLICPKFLDTLSKEDYLSGIGEIIKFNILKDTLNNFKELYSKQDNYSLIYDSLKAHYAKD